MRGGGRLLGEKKATEDSGRGLPVPAAGKKKINLNRPRRAAPRLPRYRVRIVLTWAIKGMSDNKLHSTGIQARMQTAMRLSRS